jgi:hypothetical protein
MDGDADIPVQLACGHVVGDTCISKWMSTKNTCPLCRFELLHVDHDDDLWIDQHDSFQPLGAPAGYGFASSYVPEYPWEEVSVSELGLSPAHSSTATHRFFEVYATPRSAQQQQARRPPRMHTKRGRRSVRKASISNFALEDIWITALLEEKDDLDEPGIEDVWLTALDDDEEDFRPLQTYFPPQLPVQKLYNQEDMVSDCVFDDVLTDHLHWMEDVAEDVELNTYDEYDYLV